MKAQPNDQPSGVRVVLLRKAPVEEHAKDRDIRDLDAYATNIMRSVRLQASEPLAKGRTR